MFCTIIIINMEIIIIVMQINVWILVTSRLQVCMYVPLAVYKLRMTGYSYNDWHQVGRLVGRKCLARAEHARDGRNCNSPEGCQVAGTWRVTLTPAQGQLAVWSADRQTAGDVNEHWSSSRHSASGSLINTVSVDWINLLFWQG